MSSRKKKRQSVPGWATTILEDFLDESDQLSKTLHICAKGISMVQNTPRAIEVLMKVQNEDSEKSKEDLQRAKAESTLAKTEVENGFPVLNSWGVVAYWALLEAMVRQFTAEHIRRRRSSWSLPELKRIRIRLGEYESIPQKHRYLYVAELLEKEVAAGIRNGVQRFESLLAPFDLDGEVPNEISKIMYEFG